MRFRAIVVVAAAVVLAVSVLNACTADPESATSSSKGAPVSALPADAPVVAFYGDSYTLGTGASSESKRWSTIICAQRGWNEFNPSVNGLGFVNNRVQDGIDEPALIVSQHPDIVFVTMGLNDNFSYPQAAKQIHQAIIGDLSGLKAQLPNARFIVVEPFWYTDERPKSLTVIINWVHEEAVAIGADYIPGASHWIEHHPEWMASDGLHPNDAGYAHMAVKMDAALTRLGL
ncbi:MAG: SGNH/GDSL hydrolase family protein [Pseudolysinimonas sp.]